MRKLLLALGLLAACFARGDVTWTVTPLTRSQIAQVFYQIGLPVILPPSGTIGNNGALTVGTSLQTTWANCYMYFPSGAIASGSAAGVYFVQMSSATVGTIYNNTLASGAPVIPASPTPFATTGPGAYTQTTASNIALLTLPIPGNSFGANGKLVYEGAWVVLNNADTKSYTISYGGTNVQATSSGASLAWLGFYRTIHNRGSTGAQTFLSTAVTPSSDISNQASGFTSGGVDTTQNQNLVINANIATATDYWILVGVTVTATYAP